MKVPFNIDFSLKRSIRAIATAVCAVVLTSGAAFAQDGAGKSESKLMVGFKSGFNISDVRVAGATDFFTKQEGGGKEIAPQIHVFGRYSFTKWVSTDLELGWTQNAFSMYGNRISTFRANNFQANALLNVRIPVLSVYEPRLYIGPSYNYNAYVYERITGPSSVGVGKVDYTQEVTSLFNPHDLGVIVGAGLQFDVKFATLLVDARYRHGFSKAVNSQGYTGTILARDSKVHISDLAFMVGLGFSL